MVYDIYSRQELLFSIYQYQKSGIKLIISLDKNTPYEELFIQYSCMKREYDKKILNTKMLEMGTMVWTILKEIDPDWQENLANIIEKNRKENNSI